jgi:hypothetical protein
MYDEESYESRMVAATKAKTDGLNLYSKRERWEDQLVRFSPCNLILELSCLTAFSSCLSSAYARPLLELIHPRSTLPTSPGSSSRRSQTAISSKPSTLELSPMPSREAHTKPSLSGSALSAISYVSLLLLCTIVRMCNDVAHHGLQQSNVKIESIVLQQLAKAVRSVPGSGEIWAAYIRSLVCSVLYSRRSDRARALMCLLSHRQESFEKELPEIECKLAQKSYWLYDRS